MTTDKQKRFLIGLLYYGAILAIAIFLCRYALGPMLPLIIAFLVNLLLQRPIELLHGRLRMKRSAAGALCVVVFYLLIGALMALLGVWIFGRGRALVEYLPEAYNNEIEPALGTVADLITGLVGRVNPGATVTVQSMTDSLGSALEASVSKISSAALSAIGAMVVSFPRALVNTIITIIATAFLAVDYPRVRGFVIRQLSEEQHGRLRAVRQHLGKHLGGFFRSYALIMVITFAELSLGFLLIGIPNGILLAAVIAVIDILPVLGCGTILIPWSGIALLMGEYRMGICIGILYLVITVIRQSIEPKLVGDHMGLHPVVTLLSMVVGTYVFGGIGLLGLPITLAICVSLQKEGIIRFFRPYDPEEEPPIAGGPPQTEEPVPGATEQHGASAEKPKSKASAENDENAAAAEEQP